MKRSTQIALANSAWDSSAALSASILAPPAVYQSKPAKPTSMRVSANRPRPAPEVPAIPSQIDTAAPGLNLVEKDVNQGRVSLVLPTVYWNHPDYHALAVMNDILGGSGFT